MLSSNTITKTLIERLATNVTASGVVNFAVSENLEMSEKSRNLTLTKRIWQRLIESSPKNLSNRIFNHSLHFF